MTRNMTKQSLLRILRSRYFDTFLLVGALGVVTWRFWPVMAAALGTNRTGDPAPELAVRTLHGDSISLAALRGKVVLVNFWATWCPPCRAEMPGFQHVFEQKKDRGFVVLGLASDDEGPITVSEFLLARGITYPIAMASRQDERRFGGINALPTSFLIDRRGRLRYQVRGIFPRPALDQAVDRLLAEPAPAGAD